MKKLMLIAAACVALASCVKNEVEPIVNDAPISFNIAQGVETRGAFVGAADDFKFNSTVFLTAQGKNWSSDHTGAVKYIDDEKDIAKGSGTEWESPTKYYWPNQGLLTFFSYAPWNTTTDPSITWNADRDLVISDIDLSKADHSKDLVIAQIVNDINNKESGSAVATKFSHKLTNVVIKFVKDAADDRDITITDVHFTNMEYKGEYTMPYDGSTDGWVPGGALHTYDNLLATTGREYEVTKIATAPALIFNYFLPHKFSTTYAPELWITYTIEYPNTATETVVYHKPLADLDNETGLTNDDEWKMNEQIIFNIAIEAPKPIKWAPEVEEWDTETINITI